MTSHTESRIDPLVKVAGGRGPRTPPQIRFPTPGSAPGPPVIARYDRRITSLTRRKQNAGLRLSRRTPRATPHANASTPHGTRTPYAARCVRSPHREEPGGSWPPHASRILVRIRHRVIRTFLVGPVSTTLSLVV